MTDTKKRSRWLALLALPVLSAVAYLAGPRPAPPALPVAIPQVNANLEALEAEIDKSEAAVENLKADNEARIVWADPAAKTRTACSVVYLHGFSASQGEGEPIHREFAERYGCNLFLARLDGHGLESAEPLKDITADSLLETGAFALAVGQALGDKVYVMGTSTGAPIALQLVADHGGVDGLVLYSPNIRIAHPAMVLASLPWGLRITRLAAGGESIVYPDEPAEVQQYWQCTYRVEALVAVQNLVANTMDEDTFGRVDTPVFVGAYYKDEDNQDGTVSVAAMRWMFENLGTPAENKRMVEFPDVGVHPLASVYASEDLDSVRAETFAFADDVLGLVPVPEPVVPEPVEPTEVDPAADG